MVKSTIPCIVKCSKMTSAIDFYSRNSEEFERMDDVSIVSILYGTPHSTVYWINNMYMIKKIHVDMDITKNDDHVHSNMVIFGLASDLVSWVCVLLSHTYLDYTSERVVCSLINDNAEFAAFRRNMLVFVPCSLLLRGILKANDQKPTSICRHFCLIYAVCVPHPRKTSIMQRCFYLQQWNEELSPMLWIFVHIYLR